MPDLEDLLKDPRSHRAVPSADLVERVQDSSLRAWRSEQTHSPKHMSRFGRTALLRASTCWAVCFAALALSALMRARVVPSLDRSLAYHVQQLFQPIASGMVYHPVQTACSLAIISCGLGFLLMPRASRTALALGARIRL